MTLRRYAYLQFLCIVGHECHNLARAGCIEGLGVELECLSVDGTHQGVSEDQPKLLQNVHIVRLDERLR